MDSLVGAVEVLVGGLDFLAVEVDSVEGVQLLAVAVVDLLNVVEGVTELIESGGTGEGLEVEGGWHGMQPFRNGLV